MREAVTSAATGVLKGVRRVESGASSPPSRKCARSASKEGGWPDSSDIDLDAGVLAVRGTLGRVGGKLIITEPKTERSRRSMPTAAPLVAMLRAHRADQDAERLAAGDQWQDHGLVFASKFGTPADPRNVLRTVQIASQKAGMADVGVHPFGTARQWRGLRGRSTSGPSPICWGTARSPSRVTSMGIPETTPHGRQSRAWPSDSAFWTSELPLPSTAI
jgi:hypothetical protein